MTLSIILLGQWQSSLNGKHHKECFSRVNRGRSDIALPLFTLVHKNTRRFFAGADDSDKFIRMYCNVNNPAYVYSFGRSSEQT
jgi:hypothetical protein